MSLIESFYGGYGITQVVGVTDLPAPQDKTPPLGAAVNSAQFQNIVPRVSGPAAWNGINLDVCGAIYNWTPGNGMLYDAPGYRLYSTYRKMDDHPTLKLARHMLIDPILMATWSVAGIEKTTNPKWVDCVKEQLLPQLPLILPDIFRAASYGWQALEKIWEMRGKKMWCTLRAWYPDYSEIFIARLTGKFSGLRIMGGSDILPPNRCIPIVHNGESHNLYGHSNHDAAYDAYNQWGRNQIDLMKLRAKLSGILPVLTYPPGKQPDGTDNSEIAQKILDSLGMGNGVAMPSVQYDMSDMARNPDLAKISLWNLTFQDNGALSPAITGYLEIKNSYKVDMFNAWGLPERTGMEGKNGNGGRAESGQHTDNSITTKEELARKFAYQLSHGIPSMGISGVADDILLYNYGPEAVGQVELRVSPLADVKLELKAKYLENLLACTNPQLAIAMTRATNMPDLMSDVGIPASDEPFNVDEFEQATGKAAEVVQPPPVMPGKTKPGQPVDLKLSRFKRRLAFVDER